MSSKIALLIDAENISHKDLPCILKEVSRQGEIILHAIYADWDNPTMQKWQELATAYKFKIRHQGNKAQTKNASDMRLIMDAMEILYRTQVDVFCIVSNDADYLPLCEKVREAKKYVIGVGYQHASEMLIRSCNQFIFIGRGEPSVQPLLTNSAIISNEVAEPNNLPAKPVITAKVPATISPQSSNQANIANTNEIRKLLNEAFSEAPQDENRWVTLSALGSALSKIQNGFKANKYGHSTLSKLLESMPDYLELQTKGTVKSARLKKKK